MIYGSVCSGIEAATMAWHDLGWRPAFFSEIEDFPINVLKYRHPNVPVHGDFTTIKGDEYGPIQLLVGGTPCQSFSIAGLRKGMDDDRGNLALEFLKLAQRTRPRWIVWENVPGVLSSWSGDEDGGDTEDESERDVGSASAGLCGREEGERFEESADFACFLEGLQVCGYECAWRVLDAQYFGVAQRRNRVFVVGYLGDWRPAAAVLFERESLFGNPPPSRKTQKDVAPTVTGGPPFSRTGNERVETDALVIKGSHWDDPGNPHPTLNQSAKGSGGIAASNQEIFSQRGGGLVPHEKPCVIDRAAFNQGKGAQFGIKIEESDTIPALVARGPHAVGMRTSYAPEVAAVLETTCHDYSRADGFNMIAHTLRGEGFDASEDGTGRQNLIPVLRCKACGNIFQDKYGSDIGGLAPYECDRCGEEKEIELAPPICWDEEMNAREDMSGAMVRGGDGGRHAGVAVPVAYGMKTAQTGSNGWGITEDVTNTLDTSMGLAVAQPMAIHGTQDPDVQDDCAHTLGRNHGQENAIAFQPRIARNGRGQPEPICPALNGADAGETSDSRPCVAYPLDLRNAGRDPEKHDDQNRQGVGVGAAGDPAPTVSATFQPGVATMYAVRRLTPRECERLQGFPDDYTDVPIGNKKASDSARYKALGNSMAVPVMAWIGKRIQMFEDLKNEGLI